MAPLRPQDLYAAATSSFKPSGQVQGTGNFSSIVPQTTGKPIPSGFFDQTPTGSPASAPTTPKAPAAPPPPQAPFDIPPIAADEQGKANAIQDYGSSAGAAELGIGNAAYAYGDPSAMSQYGVATVNPNSQLATAALRAQQASDANRNVRGNQGSLFSSFALRDQSTIQAAHDRANLAAYDNFQRALQKFNAAMTAAQTARDRGVQGFNEDELQQALKGLPTPSVTSGGSPTQGTIPSKPSAGAAPAARPGRGPSSGTPQLVSGTIENPKNRTIESGGFRLAAPPHPTIPKGGLRRRI